MNSLIDKVIDTVFGADAPNADHLRGVYAGLTLGLLIGYIAIDDFGLSPLFRSAVIWLLPLIAFLALIAQRRRISKFGSVGQAVDQYDESEYLDTVSDEHTSNTTDHLVEPDSNVS